MKTLLFAILFLAACTTVPSDMMTDDAHDGAEWNDDLMDDSVGVHDWMNVQLTDVNTGEYYTIAALDKPTFVESFAVWCPTCTRQQLEFKKFHESNDGFESITLDTDPNEDALAVKTHAEVNGFTWRYSVSPAELTQGLIDEFGLGIVNAPAVPVIFICPGKEPVLLGRGIKDQNDLSAALTSCEAA